MLETVQLLNQLLKAVPKIAPKRAIPKTMFESVQRLNQLPKAVPQIVPKS